MKKIQKKTVQLPNFTLLSASAGSGKTTALTLRFLQLLLSDGIPNNGLRNILAVTFTNNAALEMKQRILEYLKRASFGDDEILDQMEEFIGLDRDLMIRRSGEEVDRILENYSDFQVQTIDSFLSRIMKSSALEFGLPPSFEVILSTDAILDEAFELLAEELGHDEEKRRLFEKIIDVVNKNQGSDRKFLWNPGEKLSGEVKKIYRRLASNAGESAPPPPKDAAKEMREKILNGLVSIGDEIARSGFAMSKKFENLVGLARKKDFDGIIGKKLSQPALLSSKEKKFQAVQKRIGEMQRELSEAEGEYHLAAAIGHYAPFVEVNRQLLGKIESVRRKRSEVALSEATKMLAGKISEMNLPEIYFSLGEQIYHFLIDEFQDTSPIQWAAIRPLVEESLGKSGSLFLVGDTKQAIFTFRGGDWQIMARMKGQEEFPSVRCQKLELNTNFRSSAAVVEFGKKVFHEIVPGQVEKEIADLSGLVSYKQEASGKAEGYVEVRKYDKPEDESGERPEKSAVMEIIRDCRKRGYDLGDISILTSRNQDVIAVSGWLNAEGIKFISHSSLDIRRRKIVGEIISLMKFLDSPVDDLSFASFLLSDIFAAELRSAGLQDEMRGFLFERRRAGKRQALYADFRESYPRLWERNFEHLFNMVGYLPIYDLGAEIFKRFNLFLNFSGESATLAKLLETINIYEGRGSLTLREFLVFADEESEEESWSISIPPTENAVTVMTIHKAKGLGFPVVIPLFYDVKPKYDSMVLCHGEDGIRLLHITQKETGQNEYLRENYERKETLRQLDELNRLYVALTRAQSEMYVLSVRDRPKKPSAFLPDEFTAGKKLAAGKRKKEEEKETRIIFPTASGISQSNNLTKISLRETRRGDFVHAVLEKIIFVGDSPEKQVRDAIEKTVSGRRGNFDPDEMFRTIYDFIRAEGVSGYFRPRPGRSVLAEQEIVAATGDLFRADRINLDDDAVTVIDFKTGSRNDRYAAQVRGYMALLSEKFAGRRIAGAIAYVDLGISQEVL